MTCKLMSLATSKYLGSVKEALVILDQVLQKAQADSGQSGAGLRSVTLIDDVRATIRSIRGYTVDYENSHSTKVHSARETQSDGHVVP